MKFARYLQDSQAPEWQKAYIDYRGLKKIIAEIRTSQEASHANRRSSVASRLPTFSSLAPNNEALDDASGTAFPDVIDISAHAPRDRDVIIVADRPDPATSDGPRRHSQTMSRIRHSFSNPSRRFTRGLSLVSLWSDAPWKTSPLAGLPLFELYKHLGPLEMRFLTMLDAQLDKVESFYTSKEGELEARSEVLKEQFKELGDHRRVVHKVYPSRTSVWNFATKYNLRFRSTKPDQSVGSNSIAAAKQKCLPSSSTEREHQGRRAITYSPNPESYLHAKKRLKKAVIEHYRAVETLHNYRILNVTGFRKALKKFEKVTKTPVQAQYMSEKVDRSSLAFDKSVRIMMKDMEEQYGATFLRGNTKRAREYLRGGPRVATHYVNTFRSGICLGMGLPPLILGLYLSFQPYVREQIRGWDTLLYIYGIFFVPVTFLILITINLMTWVRFRINYVFIFELSTKTYIDYRQYLELPSWIFVGLCYAFCFSFARIGYPNISPSYWLLVWLGFTTILLFNPLPIWVRSSRIWILKVFGRVLLSGIRPVEFADFWLADQLCSFSFTLSNLPLVVCAYSTKFDDVELQKCSDSSWPVQYILTMLPLLFRFNQSLKRYYESGIFPHLINAGKYGTGIISYLFYYLWRASSERSSSLMAIWCMFNTAYAIYAGTWDMWIDWSLLDSHSPYRFLRVDMVYPHSAFYYIAIVTNIIIRFAWAAYIPQNGLNARTRAFIIGFLEVFRRWQWNFFRVENEHIGNVDQYRITREVPLPYDHEEQNYEIGEEVVDDGIDEDSQELSGSATFY